MYDFGRTMYDLPGLLLKKIIPPLFLGLLMLAFAAQAHAQEFNDEMKKRLRESLIVPEQKPLHYQHQPAQVSTPLPQNQEVLKVSPTTKLPTKYDRLQVLYPHEKFEPKVSLRVTNAGKSQVERSRIDYSTGKVYAVPDARSITQWVHYTRGDYGSGIYADDDAADWVKKLSKMSKPATSGFDADPVRAIQNHKARKRQEKVNKILKAYGQD